MVASELLRNGDWIWQNAVLLTLARGIVETETRVNVPGRGMDGGNINTCYEGSVLKTNRKAM